MEIVKVLLFSLLTLSPVSFGFMGFRFLFFLNIIVMTKALIRRQEVKINVT